MVSAYYEDPPALDFNNLNLKGRDNEIKALNKAYHRSLSSSSRPQTVWLKGDPGVGKSALVEHLFLQKDYYCFGKFEKLGASVPYSALAQLLTTLCYTLEYEGIKISTLSSADEESISSLVPEVSSILTAAAPSSSAASVAAASRDTHDTLDDSDAGASFSSDDSGACDSSSAGCQDEWRMERLKQALKSFLRAVCDDLKSPVIMFLDDLQWADLDSLEVLKDLLIAEDNDAGGGDVSSSLSDKKTKKKKRGGNGILFIGAYRDNEVQELCHPLAQCIRHVSEHLNHHQEQHRFSEVHLANLDLQGTTMLVADLTNSREDTVMELSELVHSKTNGNCFYTLHVLRRICEKNFLYVSKVTHQWEWNAESIREEVQVSDNIAEFLSRKLDELPPDTQRALAFAAFFGTKVELNLLESFVVRKYPTTPSLLELLQPAVESNLIKFNDCSHTKVKTMHFTHDRLTSAAYNMIPTEGRQQELLHLEIGWYMHELVLSDGDTGVLEASFASRSDTNGWRMVHAIDHLNRGTDLLDSRKERVLVASMNLTAAHQVLQTGAFKIATGFLETGVQLLGVHRWEMDYKLTLGLSNTHASVLYSNGNMGECQDLLQEIISNASRDEDRYDALSIQLEVLESTGQVEKCLEVGMSTLEGLGVRKIPRKPNIVQLIAGVVSAKKALRKLSDKDILSLPVCHDPKKEFIMRHMNCLAGIAYLSCREELMAIIGYRILQMTLLDGATRYSAYAFCFHAGSLGAMGDLAEAFRFAQLAVRLMKGFKTDYRAASFAHGVMFHLKTALPECVNNTLQVYHSAFAKGDVQAASLACMMHCSLRFMAGMDLEIIVKDCFVFCNQLIKYGHGRSLMFKYFLLTLRVALELMERTDELTQYLENAQDDRVFELYVASDGNKTGGNFCLLATMGPRYILGDMDSAIELGERCWYATDRSAFFAFSPTNYVFKALTALEVYKRRGKRKHLRVFQQSHKKLRKWVDDGNPNTHHFVLLLDAHQAIIQKRSATEVQNLFNESIRISTRGGFVKDAALTNECAGRYFLERKDVYWAEHYLKTAHERYTDWNATAKVRQLETEFKLLKSTRRRRQSNVSLTGRSRDADVAQAEAKRDGSGVLPGHRLSSGSIDNTAGRRLSSDSIDTRKSSGSIDTTSRRLSSDSIDTRKSNGSIDTNSRRLSSDSFDTRKSIGSIGSAGGRVTAPQVIGRFHVKQLRAHEVGS